MAETGSGSVCDRSPCRRRLGRGHARINSALAGDGSAGFPRSARASLAGPVGQDRSPSLLSEIALSARFFSARTAAAGVGGAPVPACRLSGVSERSGPPGPRRHSHKGQGKSVQRLISCSEKPWHSRQNSRIASARFSTSRFGVAITVLPSFCLVAFGLGRRPGHGRRRKPRPRGRPDRRGRDLQQPADISDRR